MIATVETDLYGTLVYQLNAESWTGAMRETVIRVPSDAVEIRSIKIENDA